MRIVTFSLLGIGVLSVFLLSLWFDFPAFFAHSPHPAQAALQTIPRTEPLRKIPYQPSPAEQAHWQQKQQRAIAAAGPVCQETFATYQAAGEEYMKTCGTDSSADNRLRCATLLRDQKQRYHTLEKQCQ